MSNSIIVCNEHDLLRINSKAKLGQMYFATDSRALYKDTGPTIEQRFRFNAVIVNTDYERTNNIKPVIGKFYYVVDTNSLWLFDTRWVLKIGNSESYNTYYSNDYISPIINTDSSITGKYGDKIIDNNGLLGNGAVVIRDENRMSRCILQSDNLYKHIKINSYMDDGLLFIPNAHLPYSNLSTSFGALHLTVDKRLNDVKDDSLALTGTAYYYGTWNNYGNMYLINEDKLSIINANYIPINNFEIVKFYIECSTKINNELIKTYMVIRPTSSSNAIVQIISFKPTALNSVVTNDIGELIFTNHGDLIENETIECTREINTTDSSYISTYIIDKYNARITISQNKYQTTYEVNIPEQWSDSSNDKIYSRKWTKDEILTVSKLQKELNTLKQEIEKLKTK